jgi:hypothetical protein
MNQRQAVTAIAYREPFQASALSGENGPTYHAGRLYGEDLEQFRADRDSIVYTVMSYATPIAWVRQDGSAHIVAQRFSVTTSKHQSIVRRALA